MSDELSPKQAAFVAEYLKDRNAAAAATRAGYSARSAAGLLESPAIKAELEKRRPEKAPAATDESDLQALIREADQAIELAKQSNNAGGIVSAIQLKARLMGQLRGNELAETSDAPKPETEVDIKKLALAIISVFREALGGQKFFVVGPGETILRVRDPDRLAEVMSIVGDSAEPFTPLEDKLAAKKPDNIVHLGREQRP